MVKDIRDSAASDHWARFGAMMGADGLLTYRYLGRRTVWLHDVDHDSMRIRRDMRNAAGGLMAAPLAIATAEAGGFTDIESVPAPVTAALQIVDDGRGVKEILIRRTFVHRGRSMGFSRAEVVDAADPARLIAVSESTGVKLADAPGGYQPLETRPEIEDSPSLPPLHAVFGATRRSEGVWVLPPLAAGNASTSGSLHIGPTHIALEAAAVDLAAASVGTDRIQAESWSVFFTARGTHGPFVTNGIATTGQDGRVACRLELRDEGREGRVVASAQAVFRVI